MRREETMRQILSQSTLDQLVHRAVEKKYIYGAVFYVSSADKSVDLISASGNMHEDSPYFIASINKLFISSIILKLATTKTLNLNDKISKYLSDEILQGLHVYRGKEYSYTLSIAHLMSQTSGLPCYLIDKQSDGKKFMQEIEAGIDQQWPINKVIKKVKGMKPHFPPGEKNRAKYTDTNHQILGLIIENITGEPIRIVLKTLFRELGLSQTKVYEEGISEKFIPIRYKSKIMHIPMFLNSTQNDIISTARDQMAFLKAFFDGYFYPKEHLYELEKWNKIFFPFYYGVGIEKFSLPRIFSPFHPASVMIGHCGSTGAVAFYIPKEQLYITGTINQQAKPNVAFQTMIGIIQATKKAVL